MRDDKPLHKRRAILIGGFFKLGFISRTAFYNVCMSLDCTLNGFDLVEFYNNTNCKPSLVSRLESILEALKNE